MKVKELVDLLIGLTDEKRSITLCRLSNNLYIYWSDRSAS